MFARQVPSRRADGFTLVEILVVIAVIAVIVALLLPAIQKARESANRTRCASNLRQVGLALHTSQDTFVNMPPAVNLPYRLPGNLRFQVPVTQDQTWSWYLLPFIDQATLFGYWTNYTGTDAGRCWASSFPVEPVSGGTTHRYGPPAPVIYRCPSDPTGPRVGAHRAYAHDGTHPTLNYVANYEFLGNGSPRIPVNCPDGASVTILCFERYGFGCQQPSSAPMWTYGVLGVTAPVLYFDANGQTGGRWKKFQRLPNQSTECDPYTAQGMHPAGTNVLLCDASVKLIAPTLSTTTWHAAVTPASRDAIDNSEW